MELDRNGDLWVRGEKMLLRLERVASSSKCVEQNLPWNTQLGSYAGGLLDTEGSIWFSNPKGLERLSYSPLVKQELTGEGFYFALAADE